MYLPSLYYNKQPIVTHGMCKVTGQDASANKKKEE